MLIFVLLSFWKKRPLFPIACRFLFCQPCVLLTKKESTSTSRNMCAATGTKFGQRIGWIFVMAIVYALIGEIKLVSPKWLWTACWIEWAGCRFACGTCGTQMRRKQLWIKLHAGKGTSSSETMAQGPTTAIWFMEWTDERVHLPGEKLEGRYRGRENAKTIKSRPFTLRSFVAWFLDDVLVKMLPTMQQHGITWIGCANRLGQKPSSFMQSRFEIAQAARNDVTFSKQGPSPNSHQLPSMTVCCSVWMLPSSRPFWILLHLSHICRIRFFLASSHTKPR